MNQSQELDFFLHAINLCDTTSALFWRGKTNLNIILQNHRDFIAMATLFLLPFVSHETVAEVEDQYGVALYGRDVSIDYFHVKDLQFQLIPKSSANIIGLVSSQQSNCLLPFFSQVTSRANSLGEGCNRVGVFNEFVWFIVYQNIV